MDSYEDRLLEQKRKVSILTTLYVHSHDIPGRRDTLTEADFKAKKSPTYAVRRALKGIRNVAQTGATNIGNIVSEAAGTSVMQTNSPHNRVNASLNSAKKAQMLARRIYYSFRKPDAESFTLEDIAAW